MLQYQTIEPTALELLKSLSAIPEFQDLRLVGGTSLALQIGHRKSIDLDLFGTIEIEPDELLDLYTNKYVDGSAFMILKSLIYFEDAEDDPEPYMFEPIDWYRIKSELRNQVAELT